MRKTLPALSIAVFATALAGCDIYFGDPNDGNNNYTYCDSTGCYYCDDYGCYPQGGGWECQSNDDCAAGCYCDDYGYCQEAGFCSSDSDCAYGFVCDDRSSCVPDPNSNGCTTDGCPDGMLCDAYSDTCYFPGCTSNADCAEGCYCDVATGTCVETGFCSTNADCPSGEECDTSRSTCMPCDNGVCGCQSNADCDAGQLCDSTSLECRAPTCTEITAGNFGTAAEDMCLADLTCEAIYSGQNCTNPTTHQACQDGDSGCVCETFDFAACIDGA